MQIAGIDAEAALVKANSKDATQAIISNSAKALAAFEPQSFRVLSSGAGATFLDQSPVIGQVSGALPGFGLSEQMKIAFRMGLAGGERLQVVALGELSNINTRLFGGAPPRGGAAQGTLLR